MSLDPQKMMELASQMQADMAKAQADLADARVEATSGGGMVTVTASGTGAIVGLKINPAAVDPADVEMLQDLILAAITEVSRQSADLQQKSMGAITGGLGGLGIPGL